jgi:hypothetical protein
VSDDVAPDATLESECVGLWECNGEVCGLPAPTGLLLMGLWRTGLWRTGDDIPGEPIGLPVAPEEADGLIWPLVCVEVCEASALGKCSGKIRCSSTVSSGALDWSSGND